MKLTEYIDLVEDLASAILDGEAAAAASLAQIVKSAGREIRTQTLQPTD
ncbi:hypothetical protein RBS60_15165 [Sinomonas sp. ASV486]|uniref:Uncharacterized protein n=1 Tax=Sinomonas puerhi TaxID=3238584 RepID=A0AB39KYG7_9MICC|nr:hypothetical protein [Sinomonas sp. ASV486]MDQ4491540.1 hypothetical protein [Sinomonas sp. ASV486]